MIVATKKRREDRLDERVGSSNNLAGEKSWDIMWKVMVRAKLKVFLWQDSLSTTEKITLYIAMRISSLNISVYNASIIAYFLGRRCCSALFIFLVPNRGCAKTWEHCFWTMIV